MLTHQEEVASATGFCGTLLDGQDIILNTGQRMSATIVYARRIV